MKDLKKRIDRIEGALNVSDEMNAAQEQLGKRLEAARKRVGIKKDSKIVEIVTKHTGNISLAERLKEARERRTN